jgi:3-hydroxy-9,10-secoandrosta-1,3,5(10)-triene-9,17-dione monooxygenase reductase component
MITRVNSPVRTLPSQFRAALGAFATGVTIVTTRDRAGADVGLTASSFNSVSLDPPMVLWSLAKDSLSLPAFMECSHFGVHVLAANQQALADLFATRGANKFSGLHLKRGRDDIPLLPGCSARFQCKSTYQYQGGDHVIFVGEVLDFEQMELAPLVFHSGRYAIATAKPESGVSPWYLKDESASSFSQDFLIFMLGRAHYQLFLRLRRDLEQHGLAEGEWFVLSILGAGARRTLSELDGLVASTGTRVTYDQLAGLAAAGFVHLHGAYDADVQVDLTEKGRQAVIELVAAAKAAESDAEQHLGVDESRLLKQWLKLIIRDSDPGPPATWRGP